MNKHYYSLFFAFSLVLAPLVTQATLKDFLKRAGTTVALNVPHYLYAALPTALFIQDLTNNDQIEAYKQKKLGTEPASPEFQELIRKTFTKVGITEPDKLNLYKLPAALAATWRAKHIINFTHNNDFYLNQEYYSTLPQEQQEALLVVAGLELKRHTNKILVGAAYALPCITELTSFIFRNTLFKNIWREIQQHNNEFAFSTKISGPSKYIINILLIALHQNSHKKRILSEAVSILGTSDSLKQYYNNLYVQTRNIIHLNTLNYLKNLN